MTPVEALERVADLLVRLLISYALSAPDDPPEVVSSMVAAVLVGGIPALAPTPVTTLPEETR